MEISTIGIDIAKRIFHIHGIDKNGKMVLRKTLMRDQLLNFIANLPKCLIGIEACGSANYWARELIKLGHEVKLISPQFVKPYVKTNKNDKADAEAISEAVSRPNMRFVPIKTIEQQDILCLHRIRERLVKSRTALSNEIRGLLYEFGIIIPQGIDKIIPNLHKILDERTKLTEISNESFQGLLNEFIDINKKIKDLEKRIKIIVSQEDSYKKLIEIPGIGLLTASSLIASIGNGNNFKNGRQLSAWLGLVPKQHSSGGKEKLLGISKRGDIYLRTLFIHGARAVFNARKIASTKLKVIGKESSRFSNWMLGLNERRGYNRTVVAVANKLARVAYAVLTIDNQYNESKVCI